MKPEFSLWLNACLNNTDGVKKALDAGARADFSGPRGFSPLHIAAEKDNNEMAALLLAHGACPYRGRDPKNLLVEFAVGVVATAGTYIAVNQMMQKYPDDVTPLEIAADRGNHDFIKLLVPFYRQHRAEHSYYGPKLVNDDFERAIRQAQLKNNPAMHETLSQVKYEILTPQPTAARASFVQEIGQRLRHGWRHRFYGSLKPSTPKI